MPTFKVLDDLGRELKFAQPPQRIVSLVPSDTYSLIALGAAARIVAHATPTLTRSAVAAPRTVDICDSFITLPSFWDRAA